jgi:hypothetical protein
MSSAPAPVSAARRFCAYSFGDRRTHSLGHLVDAIQWVMGVTLPLLALQNALIQCQVQFDAQRKPM